MITIEKLLSLEKEAIPQEAEVLESKDITQLVEWLSSKDDKIRYPALLLLQSRSNRNNDVYPFWDIFRQKLRSDNSYQRSIGLMLLAENARWDTENRLDEAIDDFLAHVSDEKPITARQCIQALHKMIPWKEHLLVKIADTLLFIDLGKVKETMRKPLLTDILSVLAAIRKIKSSDEIESYIFSALSGELLDKKAKKEIEALL